MKKWLFWNTDIMKTDPVRALYEQYGNSHDTSLQFYQFEVLLIFFPAIQVIMSDEVIDDDEWKFFRQLASFMAESETQDPELQKDLHYLYLNEITFMIEHMADWKKPFTYTLRLHSKNKPEVKASIMDTLYLITEASGGATRLEKEKIYDIVNQYELR